MLALALAMQGSTWGGGVAADCGDAVQDKCRVIVSVLGPLQTVQRAEFWCTILALQAFWLGHLGVVTFKLSGPLVGCLIRALSLLLSFW